MSSRNLYIAATIACMTGALFGYSVGYIGGILVLPSFLRHFSLDQLPARQIAVAQSKIVSSWLVGCVIGVPLSLPICSRYGRKLCISFSATLYILGAILQLVHFNNSIAVFQLGRWINGIGVGAGTLVSPLYISEISPASERGPLISGYQVAIQILALVGFWGAFICHSVFDSNLQWQVPVLFQLVPGCILLAGSLFLLPESPQWLIGIGDPDSANDALTWLRMEPGTGDTVKAELRRLQILSNEAAAVSQRNKTSFLRQVTRQPLLKRMSVGIGLMISQNGVGLNALNYFAPVIFASAGFTSISASLFLTGIFGLVKVITSILFMFVFVRMRGNRFWLHFGSIVMAVSMFVLAFSIEQMPSPGSDARTGVNLLGFVSVAMVLIFAFAFGVSLGPISWNVCAEIFPSHISTKACTVTTCVQWISQIMIASITPPLIAAIGYWTYVMYGSFCVLALAFCFFCVPETRGVASGPDMDRAFGDPVKDDNTAEVAEIEDIDEHTPLIAHRRRRSSVAFVV